MNSGSTTITDAIFFAVDEAPALLVQLWKLSSGRYLVDLMLAGGGATDNQILPGTIALTNLVGHLTGNPVLVAHLVTEQIDHKRSRHKSHS